MERQYWRLQHQPDDELDLDSFADEVFKAFTASTTLCARRSPRCLIALSGGLDSRLVAACVPKEIDATAFTFVNSAGGASDTREVSAASEVAHRLGLRHLIKRVEPGEYSRIAVDAVRLTDGLVPFQHPSNTLQYLQQLGEGCNYLLGGCPGDAIAGSYVPELAYLDPRRTEEMVKDFCDRRKASRTSLALVFGDDFLNEFLPQVDHSMLESFTGLSGPTAAHRVTAWTMMFRLAFVFTSPIHNHPRFQEGFAHLGYQYCDLMLRLPAEWLLFRNFYSYMIYRSLPQLRDIIYANTGQPLSGQLAELDFMQTRKNDLIFRLESKAKKAKEQFKELARKWVPLALRPRVPYSEAYLLFRNDKAFLDSVEEMLDLPTVGKVVDNWRCKRFVNNFREGRLQSAALFGALATLCLSEKNSQ